MPPLEGFWWQEGVESEGYALDMTDKRLHHGLYLSDAKRGAPEKLKTVIRHPIKKEVEYGVK